MKKLLPLFSLFISYAAISQWTLQTSGTTNDLKTIYATSATNVLAGGEGGAARATTDGGASWGAMNLSTTADINSMDFTSATAGYTAGGFQNIYQTNNAGMSWSFVGGGVTALYDISVVSGQIWVCGDQELGYGFLYNQTTLYLDQSNSIQNKVLYGIDFTSTSTGYVCGQGGLIIKTTNSGSAWTSQTSGAQEDLFKIRFISATEGIAIGALGTIVKTTNGGTNWQMMNSNTTVNLNALYYANASDVWAVGDSGTVLYSNDGGVNWAMQNSGVQTNLYGVEGFGTSPVWACGENGVIIVNSGTTGTEDIVKENSISVFPNPVTNSFTVQSSFDKNLQLIVSDVSGKKLMERMNVPSNVPVDGSGLPPGIYTIQIIDADGKLLHVQQLLKQ